MQRRLLTIISALVLAAAIIFDHIFHLGSPDACLEAGVIPNPYLLEITGSNKSWSARYPALAGGQDGEKVIPASKGIHLPLGTEVILVLHSTDYVYTFSVPQQGLKELAVPGLEFRLPLRPTKDQLLELVGEGLCGDPHTEVPAKLFFESPRQFLKWKRIQP